MTRDINAGSAVYFKPSLYNRMSEININMSSSLFTGHSLTLLFLKKKKKQGMKCVRQVYIQYIEKWNVKNFTVSFMNRQKIMVQVTYSTVHLRYTVSSMGCM